MKTSLLQFCIFFGLILGNSVKAQSGSEHPPIIPKPLKAEWKNSEYNLPTEIKICYSADAEVSAKWLEHLLKNTSSEVQLSEGQNCGNFSLVLKENLKEKLGEEGYNLKVNNTGVELEAATNAGLFYGIQTLRQMFPPEIETGKINGEISLQQVKISDKPNYSWRGTMVDLARSFFGIDYLKKHIDRMALYKLNRLHLHLSDDQGWRIELKSRPKLTEIGGKSSVKNGRSGFISQEEYKELQEYAEARHIIIIPEIDMPGHTYAALMSYPELNCENLENLNPKRATPPEYYHDYRVGWSRLCMENPETYEFVGEIISELAEITHGPWIHMGGDEIEDPHYKEFVVKADSIVRSTGKTAIGWEEATQGKVDESFISQRWNGKTESVVDTKVIESICSSFYFDHANMPGQEHTNNWCKQDGVSLENTYSFSTDDPNVIGVEAPVWTELVVSDDMLDNRFWPRSMALAEVGWTKKEQRDFNNFTQRLGRQAARLENLDINYFRSPEVNWETDKKGGVFSDYMP